MCESCAILSTDDSSELSAGGCEDFQVRLQNPGSCDTFPLFTGGLRGSFSFFPILASRAQRFSPTAVYPPCPTRLLGELDGWVFGHGGYTAKG
jgi:hypothetical protein